MKIAPQYRKKGERRVIRREVGFCKATESTVGTQEKEKNRAHAPPTKIFAF